MTTDETLLSTDRQASDVLAHWLKCVLSESFDVTKKVQ